MCRAAKVSCNTSLDMLNHATRFAWTTQWTYDWALCHNQITRQSRIIPAQTQQIRSLQSEHCSLGKLCERNSNTVFAITVLTLHFKTQCLVKMANTAFPNTVFAFKFNFINGLKNWNLCWCVIASALLGTLHAQRVQYIVLLNANIDWLCSQCSSVRACYGLRL